MLIFHLYVKTNPDRRIGNHLFYGGVAQSFQNFRRYNRVSNSESQEKVEILSRSMVTKTELSVGERME